MQEGKNTPIDKNKENSVLKYFLSQIIDSIHSRFCFIQLYETFLLVSEVLPILDEINMIFIKIRTVL